MGAILGVEGARLWWRNETLAVFTLLGGHSENFGSIYPGFPIKTGFENGRLAVPKSRERLPIWFDVAPCERSC